MRYRVTLERLPGGGVRARAADVPGGRAEARGDGPEEALSRIRAEILYRLELCPCSGLAPEEVELAVEAAPPASAGASGAPRRGPNRGLNRARG